MLPFIITVANRKGGIGKTTSAVNLSAGLALRGLHVLLVDFDGQGHAALGFGLRAEPGTPTAHSIFTDGAGALAGAIRASAVHGVDVAPANQTMRHPGEEISPQILADAIEGLSPERRYDVVVIDTPPSLDSLMVSALAAADAVLMPFLAHPLAAEGISQFTRVFFEIRVSVNPRLKHLALTPVQFNANISIHRAILQKIEQQFGADRLTPAIRTDIKLAEAFGLGRPIFDTAPSSRGAQDYDRLCDALLNLWPIRPVVG